MLAALCLTALGGAACGGSRQFVKGTVTVRGQRYPYQIFLPRDFVRGSTARRWPVVLFIHGGGQRGSDGEKQLADGLGLVVQKQQATWPAVTLFPQFPRGEDAPHDVLIAIADSMLDLAMREYHGDSSRVYLTGLSFGGSLGYELASTQPNRFAAFVPISTARICDSCITGDTAAVLESSYPALAERLKALPIWMFHGAADTRAPTARARKIAAAFEAVDPRFKYTEIPGGDHMIWNPVYARADVYQWMFAQHR
jgi:predicted peptidase